MKLSLRLSITFGSLLTMLGVAFVMLMNSNTDSRLALGVSGALVLSAGGVAAWWTIRTLHDRIATTIAAAHRLTAGDLTGAIDVRDNDELSELQRLLNTLNEQFLKTISTVRNGTIHVAGTCSQINRDNGILSRHIAAQAKSLQQSAASMEQLTATVKQNSDNAQAASRLALSTSERAIKGGEVVKDAVTTMNSIEASSRKITDIVGVIDSIAFQTNILALNAAVEAARAGEQGRGFAVVASEVRLLAQRSATAAKEVKALISESVAQISAGSKLVTVAGQTMEDIVASIGNVANIVGSISAASREQSIGIEAVNQAVTELDGIAAKNAQLMKDSGKTAASLNEKAVAVLRALDQFKLGSREYGTKEEALAMVKRAVAFAHTHGIQALIDDVNKLSQGQFVDRDLYLFVLDLDSANWVAHGNNPRAVGTGADTKDVVDKRYFVREMAELMKTQGAGWIDYHWQHPVTNQHQAKTTYMERVGNVGIGCGVYKHDKT